MKRTILAAVAIALSGCINDDKNCKTIPVSEYEKLHDNPVNAGRFYRSFTKGTIEDGVPTLNVATSFSASVIGEEARICAEEYLPRKRDINGLKLIH